MLRRMAAIVVCMFAALCGAGQPVGQCTTDLQSRIDALAAQGGGTLTLTSGVYRTGALFFKPGVNLHLDEGAVIEGVDDAESYPMRETRIEGRTVVYYPALVNADGCDGFRIGGKGVIDGHGYPTWKAFWPIYRKNPSAKNVNMPEGLVRPRLLYVSNSRNVDVGGVTFRNSKFWTTHYYRCRDVRVHDCVIRAEKIDGVRGPSTDAIDVDACDGFVVSNVVMDVNDDAVALKGGKGLDADDPAKHPENGPSENVLVTDCTFGSQCHACLTLGSECIRARNVTMRNCRADGAAILLNLKMRVDTPQRYDNILVENCTGSVGTYMNGAAWSQMTELGEGAEPPFSIASNVVMRANSVCYRKFAVYSKSPFVRYLDFKVDD